MLPDGAWCLGGESLSEWGGCFLGDQIGWWIRRSVLDRDGDQDAGDERGDLGGEIEGREVCSFELSLCFLTRPALTNEGLLDETGERESMNGGDLNLWPSFCKNV